MPEPKESYMSEMDFDAIPDPKDKVSYEVEGEVFEADAAPPTKDRTPAKSEEAIEVVDDTPPEDRNRKPLGEDPDEIPEDELAEYSATVKKRISKLRHGYHDERRAKEAAAREREEALRYAQAVIEENKRLKQMYAQGEQVFAQTLSTAVEAQVEAAKRKVKDAYEAGDSDALVAAQQELASAQYKLEQSKSFRSQAPALQEERFQQEYAQRTQQPQVPATPPAYQPDTRAVEWQRRNSWFGSDDEMTSFALGVHKKLVESGVDPRTSEYYERIDARLRQVFPEKFALEEDAPPRQAEKRPATVVAPQTRASASKKIVLSRSQVAIAKRLGIPVEEYARQAALLEKQNG